MRVDVDRRLGSDRREPDGVPWQKIANVLIVICLTLGGWAWNTTTARLLELEKSMSLRNEHLAALQARSESQEQLIASLHAQLDRLEDKLDVVLRSDLRQPPSASLNNHQRFDK